MPGFYVKPEDIAEQAGSVVAGFPRKVAGAIREFACNLYSTYPDQFSLGNPYIKSFQRGYMDELCSDFPPVLPPPPLFTGGQCKGTQYTIRVAGTGANSPSGSYNTCNQAVSYESVIIQGRIQYVEEAIDNIYYIHWLRDDDVELRTPFYLLGDSSTYLVHTPACYANNFAPMLLKGSITGYTIRRVDGLPDNCGNPPGGGEFLPTTPPPVINTTTNITTNNNTEVNLDITVKKDTNNQFSFPIAFDVNGELNVILDAGGFYFDVDIEPPPRPSPDNPPPPVYNPPGGGGGGGGGDIPSPAPNPDANPHLYDTEDVSEEEEPIGESIERLEYITVAVTKRPTNPKTQSGAPGDTVYYCGFMEFKSGSNNYPRQPLHFLHNIFRAPDGADGYAVCFYEGYDGSIRVYTKKEGV